MANNTPKITIDIDVKGGQDTINTLNTISGLSGKIGKAASDATKPIQKLMSATEKGSNITTTDLQAMINSITTGIAGLERAVGAEQKAFEKEAASYQKAAEAAAKYKKQLEELQATKAKNAVSPTMSETDWLNSAERKLPNLGNRNKNYKAGYKEVFNNKDGTYDATRIMSLAKSNVKRENYKDKETGTYDEAKYQKDLGINQAAKALVQNYNEYEAANDKLIEADKKLNEQIKEVTKSYEEQSKIMNKSKDSITNSGGSIDANGSPQKSQDLTQSEQVLESTKTSTQELIDNLKTGQTQAEQTGQSLVKLSNTASSSASGFTKLTKSLVRSTVILRTLKNVLKTSIQAIKSLDDSITSMAVVTGRSRSELQGMTGDFAKMAQATSSTITEMAELTTEYLRQGRTMSDAKTLAEETAKAAKIAGISTSDSITYMTAAINGFNLSASDASHVSDIFANLAATSATDYEGLAVALSKVAAQANQAGMSIEYTTALLAKGIETTQEAPESIGTALKTIIARFRELDDYGTSLEDGMDVNSVETALKAVGIELRNESGEFRDLSEVLNELGPKWDSLTTMQKQAVAQAAAGTRQQARFLAIMQD